MPVARLPRRPGRQALCHDRPAEQCGAERAAGRSYAKWGMGGIIRMDPDGADREVFASGIRNSVGLDFNPDDRRAVVHRQSGRRHGRRHSAGRTQHGAARRTEFRLSLLWRRPCPHPRIRDETPPADVVFPEVETVAHAADLGMIFYRGAISRNYGAAFFSPSTARGTARSDRRAGDVHSVPRRQAGAGSIPFAEGWNRGQDGYSAAPWTLAELPDGSLIVSDDQEGALYRILYDGK